MKKLMYIYWRTPFNFRKVDLKFSAKTNEGINIELKVYIYIKKITQLIVQYWFCKKKKKKKMIGFRMSMETTKKTVMLNLNIKMLIKLNLIKNSRILNSSFSLMLALYCFISTNRLMNLYTSRALLISNFRVRKASVFSEESKVQILFA